MLGQWSDLGLKSRAEAGELALLYTRLLGNHNGSQAHEVIDSIRTHFPEVRKRLPAEQGVREKGRPGDGRGDSAAESRPVRGERQSSNARPVKQSGSERSLFDAGTDEQVASDAARDRNQLTGDRLTARSSTRP